MPKYKNGQKSKKIKKGAEVLLKPQTPSKQTRPIKQTDPDQRRDRSNQQLHLQRRAEVFRGRVKPSDHQKHSRGLHPNLCRCPFLQLPDPDRRSAASQAQAVRRDNDGPALATFWRDSNTRSHNFI